MNSFTPGIIIALLIMFLLGILVGYSLVQKRLQKQAEALKISQRRLAEIEQSHELRLREATERLRHDYESQLATTIEHYQDQLSQKAIEMEQVYETRFRVFQQGEPSLSAQPRATQNSVTNALSASTTVAGITQPAIAPVSLTAPAQEVPKAALRELQQQYDLQLQAATQELHQSYTAQVAEQIQVARAELEAVHEQALATRYQELEQEFAERQVSLERQLEELRSEAAIAPSTLASEMTIPTPSEIMGTGDETTMTLASSDAPADSLSAASKAQYTQDELDQRIAATTQQAQAEFEQRLSEELRTQQVQFDRRISELETSYQKRLEALGSSDIGPLGSSADIHPDSFGSAAEGASAKSEFRAEDDLFGDDGLFAETPTPSSRSEEVLADFEDDLFGDDGLFAETPPEQPKAEDAWFGDEDLFAERPSAQTPEAGPASTSEESLLGEDDLFTDTPSDAAGSDDDDDFGPLNLDDIVSQ